MHIPSRVQVEMSLPNRRIEIPEALTLASASAKLIRYTSQYPGLVLEFDEQARDLFDGYNVLFNTRVGILRKQQDADAAAEEGATCVSRLSHQCACNASTHGPVCTYIYIYTCRQAIHICTVCIHHT